MKDRHLHDDLIQSAIRGAVAQLGERQNRTLEVVGSTPIGSTIITVVSGQLSVVRRARLNRLLASDSCPLFGRARRGSSGALYPQSA